MRTINTKMARFVRAAIVAATSVLAAGTTVVMAVGPESGMARGGDTVAFAPVATPPDGECRSSRTPPCDRFDRGFDLDVASQSGGSLVTETEGASDANSYRVHLARNGLGAGAGNGGSDTPLIVHDRDLVILARAALGNWDRPKPLKNLHYRGRQFVPLRTFKHST